MSPDWNLKLQNTLSSLRKDLIDKNNQILFFKKRFNLIHNQLDGIVASVNENTIIDLITVILTKIDNKKYNVIYRKMDINDNFFEIRSIEFSLENDGVYISEPESNITTKLSIDNHYLQLESILLKNTMLAYANSL